MTDNLGSFDEHWTPRDYLDEFYGLNHINADELAAVKSQIEYSRATLTRHPRALEFGSGPTVHRAIAVSPYVSEIHIAEYLPDNLAEVERWVRRENPRHNWDLYVKYALACEGRENPTPNDIARRKAETRAKITRFMRADARRDHPLDISEDLRYAHVYSGFCADSATDNKATWRHYMRNIASLVAPGGTFWTAALRKARSYSSGPHSFPSANVDENDIQAVLELDFLAETVHVEIRELPDMKDHGFEGIILAHARKGV